MAKDVERKCPACGKVKKFRTDVKTCGCAGTNPNLATKSSPVVETSARELYLRKENDRLKKELEKGRSTTGFQEELADQILGAVQALDPLPLLPYKASSKAEAEMAAVLQLGDFHIGEVTSRSETNGFGEYNWQIAQDRAEYITNKFVGWVKSKQQLFNVPKVYILGGADWVSGDIHKELQVTNEFPLPVQAVRAGELLARMVGQIAPHVPEVHLVEIEPDNHGRLNPKPQFKQKGLNNMSFVTYAMANALLQKHGNIEIINNHRIRELINIQGQKVLVEHGDIVRSWQGIPYMGMMRHASREANKHMRATLEQQRKELDRMKQEYGFDYVALFHFHVPNIIDNQIFVNGSLSGTSEFDEGVGRYARPAQISYVMHPKFGYFDFTPWGTKI